MTHRPDLPDATLIISHWSSTCNNCGKSCRPGQKTHDIILGYGPENGKPGCGIEWTHVLSAYAGESDKKLTVALRPDLEYIDHPVLQRKAAQ